MKTLTFRNILTEQDFDQILNELMSSLEDLLVEILPVHQDGKAMMSPLRIKIVTKEGRKISLDLPANVWNQIDMKNLVLRFNKVVPFRNITDSDAYHPCEVDPGMSRLNPWSWTANFLQKNHIWWANSAK
jgi:hypothetical protein